MRGKISGQWLVASTVRKARVPVKTYQELIAWQKAITFVTAVYQVSRDFLREEIYGLTS